jgi:hypothetical protein
MNPVKAGCNRRFFIGQVPEHTKFHDAGEFATRFHDSTSLAASYSSHTRIVIYL